MASGATPRSASCAQTGADETQRGHAPPASAAHFLSRKIDARFTVITDDEAVAIAVSLDGPDDFTHQAHKLGGGCCHALDFDARIEFFADLQNKFLECLQRLRKRLHMPKKLKQTANKYLPRWRNW